MTVMGRGDTIIKKTAKDSQGREEKKEDTVMICHKKKRKQDNGILAILYCLMS